MDNQYELSRTISKRKPLTKVGQYYMSLMLIMTLAAGQSAYANSVVSTETASTSAVMSSQLADTVRSNYVNHRQNGSVVAVYQERNNPFSALVGKRSRRRARKNDAKVRRFQFAGGEKSFLFQDLGSRARIQFECGQDDSRVDCHIDPERPAAEIIILLPIRAPRGDVIYKNLQGETVLRITSYGGATIWVPGSTEAQAASRSFSDQVALSVERVSYQAVEQRALRATAIISSMAGAPISFEIDEALRQAQNQQDILVAESRDLAVATRLGQNRSIDEDRIRQNRVRPKSSSGQRELDNSRLALASQSVSVVSDEGELSDAIEAWETNISASILADGIMTVTKGMAQVASDPTGARVIGNRVKSVRFFRLDKEAEKPVIRLEDKSLQIYLNPSIGLEGRPSAADVARFLEENL